MTPLELFARSDRLVSSVTFCLQSFTSLNEEIFAPFFFFFYAQTFLAAFVLVRRLAPPPNKETNGGEGERTCPDVRMCFRWAPQPTRVEVSEAPAELAELKLLLHVLNATTARDVEGTRSGRSHIITLTPPVLFYNHYMEDEDHRD